MKLLLNVSEPVFSAMLSKTAIQILLLFPTFTINGKALLLKGNICSVNIASQAYFSEKVVTACKLTK